MMDPCNRPHRLLALLSELSAAEAILGEFVATLDGIMAQIMNAVEGTFGCPICQEEVAVEVRGCELSAPHTCHLNAF